MNSDPPPPNSCPPGTSEHDFIWKQALCKCTSGIRVKIQTKLCRIRVGLTNPVRVSLRTGGGGQAAAEEKAIWSHHPLTVWPVKKWTEAPFEFFHTFTEWSAEVDPTTGSYLPAYVSNIIPVRSSFSEESKEAPYFWGGILASPPSSPSHKEATRLGFWAPSWTMSWDCCKTMLRTTPLVFAYQETAW